MSFTRDEKKGAPFWKRLLFSDTLVNKNTAHKIAYIAVFVALNIALNFIKIELPIAKFSFTTFAAALTGLVIGPLFGFCAAFLGDLLSFLVEQSISFYSPFLGLSSGLFALIFGVVINVKTNSKFLFWIKMVLASLLTFAVCSVGINSTYLRWLQYPAMEYGEFLVYRFFVTGQIWNSLVNYALLFIAVPLLGRIKPLKLDIG